MMASDAEGSITILKNALRLETSDLLVMQCNVMECDGVSCSVI